MQFLKFCKISSCRENDKCNKKLLEIEKVLRNEEKEAEAYSK